ncbi:hypothetical protein C8J56DRAFT_899956 [Mycena floridula]|nr:hypothetical protein C8J56DRAFT_899956 [Mycena floridula]
MCQKGIPHRRWRKVSSVAEALRFWSDECLESGCRHIIHLPPPPAPQISPKKPYTTVAPPATTSTPNKRRRFFAVSSPNKGDVVFTNREEARAALLEAEGRGEEARLIYSTSLDEVEDMLDSMSLRNGQDQKNNLMTGFHFRSEAHDRPRHPLHDKLLLMSLHDAQFKQQPTAENAVTEAYPEQTEDGSASFDGRRGLYMQVLDRILFNMSMPSSAVTLKIIGLSGTR